MTINERWMNTRCCSGCGHYTNPDETILKIGKDLFCSKCSVNKTEGISCKIIDGAVKQILNKESLKSLPNGIYSLMCNKGNLFIKEKESSALLVDKNLI